MDGRRVLIGIVFVNRNGLRCCDAPSEHGPPKTLNNRWKRWCGMGVLARIMEDLASEAAEQKAMMIDATYPKAHRTASSLAVKKGGRAIGRTKCGMNKVLWLGSEDGIEDMTVLRLTVAQIDTRVNIEG